MLAKDIGLKLTTYTLRDPESDKLRILMAAEIDRAGNAEGNLALAYSLVDDKGRLIDSQIDRQVKTPVDPETSLQRYTGFILSGASGTHTLKIAVIDDRSRRGSVEYSFKAALTPLGSVRATDILLSDEKTGTGSAAPSVRGEVTSGMVNSYIEVYSDEPDLLKNTTVMFEVALDDKRARSTVPPDACNRALPIRRTAVRWRDRFRCRSFPRATTPFAPSSPLTGRRWGR